MRTYTYTVETIRTGTVTVTVPDDKTLEQVWSEAADFLAAHKVDEIPDDYSSVPRNQEFLIQ